MKTTILKNVPAGLCPTCNHSGNCVHRNDFRGVVFQCEEYNGSEPLREKMSKVPKDDSPQPYSSLKGLCMNCDFASTCTLPKPETGIWFCNEYK